MHGKFQLRNYASQMPRVTRRPGNHFKQKKSCDLRVKINFHVACQTGVHLMLFIPIRVRRFILKQIGQWHECCCAASGIAISWPEVRPRFTFATTLAGSRYSFQTVRRLQYRARAKTENESSGAQRMRFSITPNIEPDQDEPIFFNAECKLGKWNQFNDVVASATGMSCKLSARK